MILTCPSCDAQYELPDDAIGPKGRRVKCTTCAHTWTEYPDSEPDSMPSYRLAPEPVAAPRREEAPRIAFGESRASKGTVIAVSLSVAIILLALTLGGAIALRRNLVAAWPPSALFFEMIHVPVATPSHGLVIKDLQVSAKGEGMFSVAGKFNNPTSANIPLARLIIRLSGGEGWLKDWPVDLYGKTLQAGKNIGFN
ncbi:MAG: hypothetical protein JWM96_25, partial [Alphaproteobacteria bacterium]|nr:hypothetical protein [Alphaproteobacteria bacterium]